VAAPVFWRRLRQQFGIRAPRMPGRASLPWWARGVVAVAVAAVVVGMWWWGFDFGQLFGGVNRKEVEARVTTLEADAAKARSDAGELRTRNSQLESDLAMSRGAEQALSKQTNGLAAENAQLKEEVAFLQKLVADSSKQAGISIPRLTVEPEGDGLYRYNVLVVRGGNPKDDFEGHVTLQAAVTPPDGGIQTLTLPDDQPDARTPLDLRFKYYQRVEGTFRVPQGSRLTALTARAYENGNGSPRVTRTLLNP
jgi:uncharacterized protein DUF6776